MDILQSFSADRIVQIVPIGNLKNYFGPDESLFNQHFGRGHVKLSNVWDGTSPQISDFFADMAALGAIDEATFTRTSTRIGALGLDRSPKYTPTIGENQALVGSTGPGRRNTPFNPNDDNRYVTEKDEGLGEQVDLENVTSIGPNAAIERFGYIGTRIHKAVFLCIDQGLVDNTSTDFYDLEVLPRLRELLGRDPIFMDWWYDGNRLLFFNGDTWQSP